MKYKPDLDDYLAGFFFAVFIGVLIFAAPIIQVMQEMVKWTI